ncbi:RNA-directed DNA polymerase from mobile element jockey [Eumeta japonica]|uniref:RNA-directed DNA polymerase from mobile element jockey n=1 Tax=Eumeta variegata TaxID=151549 RepID=A0A4C1ZXS0_EUMVA|nr:RNA-directed DNA polymerase from mobile element jockey [Eumeta japonica]
MCQLRQGHLAGYKDCPNPRGLKRNRSKTLLRNLPSRPQPNRRCSNKWYCRVLQRKTTLLSYRYPTTNKFRSIGVQIETLLVLGDAVILFGDFNSKNTDRRCNTTNALAFVVLQRYEVTAVNVRPLVRTLATLTEDHDFAIIVPLDPRHLPANVRHRSEILDPAVLKGVVLNLSSIETLHCFGADHLPVLFKLGSFTDRRGLPADVSELIRAKITALRGTSAYPTPEYRSRSASPPTRSKGSGSTLSPLLYSTYTNDIPRPQTGVQRALFADDTALYLCGNNFYKIPPCLQKAIDGLTRWFQTWRIEVNPEKSAAIFFNYSKIKNKEVVPYNSPTFCICSSPNLWHHKYKYSGTTFDFKDHIMRVKKNAQLCLSRLSGMIGKKSKMSLRNKCTLYKVCIRPVMTYAALVFAHADSNALYQLHIL